MSGGGGGGGGGDFGIQDNAGDMGGKGSGPSDMGGGSDVSAFSGGSAAPAMGGGTSFGNEAPGLPGVSANVGGPPAFGGASSGGVSGVSTSPMASLTNPSPGFGGGDPTSMSEYGALPLDSGQVPQAGGGFGGSSAPGLPPGGGTGGGAPVSGGAGPLPAGSGGGNPSLADMTKSIGVKDPLGSAVSAAALGYNMVAGQGMRPAQEQLVAQAAMLNDQGKQLMSYLQSGDLPDGLKMQLNQATAAAKAKVIQNFANQGLSTDPTKNSVLAQQLKSIDDQALISTALLGQQLMDAGIKEADMASNLYKTLAQIDQTQTARIGQSIANFASALGGAGRPTTISIPLGGQQTA